MGVLWLRKPKEATAFEPNPCAGVIEQCLLDADAHLGIELAVHVRAQQLIVQFRMFAHFAALTRCGPSPRRAASLARARAKRLITVPTGTSRMSAVC